jgi:hypothetical protein
MRKIFCLASTACIVALAADSTVEGPTLGFVNSAAGVRSVLGIVGSSRLSGPLTGELQGAVILPGTSYAIAKNPLGALVRLNVNDGSVSSLGVENVAAFVGSPSGQFVLARTPGKLNILSRDGEAKAEYAYSPEPRLLAVSDEGATGALSVVEPDGETIYVVNAQGARRVFHAAAIAALAFVPGTRDAIFADNEGAVYRLKSDLQFTQIGSVPGVKALAGLTNGDVIAVGGRTVTAVRADGSPGATVECSCEASIARPLGQSRFVITDGDGPIWFVDASTGDLRVAFVPEAVNE